MSNNVLLITTGGTISQERNDLTSANINIEIKDNNIFSNILENYQDYNINKIHIIDAYQIDSSNLNPKHWEILVDIIYNNYEEYDSFVIIHGTNTMGYTCSALSFALGKCCKPIIITGSQVPFGYYGSDAKMNVENAIRMAGQTQCHVRGVIAVFGSYIITGTRVKKATEFDYDAMKTFNTRYNLGRIGRVIRFDRKAIDTHNEYYGIASKKYELVINSKFKMDGIISLTEFPGMNKTIITNAVDDGKVEAIILRSYGAGDPNIALEDTYDHFGSLFEYLRLKNIPIVVTTQAPEGIASMSVNLPGVLAQEHGAIPAWDMSMESITTKLAWFLAKKFSYNDIKNSMTDNMRGEITIPSEMALWGN